MPVFPDEEEGGIPPDPIVDCVEPPPPAIVPGMGGILRPRALTHRAAKITVSTAKIPISA